MSKFIKRITNNWQMKLISIIIAIGIWYFVVYSNNPVETESYQVKITVENESYITNGKQVYSIDDKNKTVTVFVKTNRSVLKDITADDIEVTADLTQIVDLNKDPVMVPLTATCKGVDAKDITLSKNTIPIVIENVESKELPVSVVTGDGIVNKDYEIGNMIPNPSSIVIYGPESVIKDIDSAVAAVDVTGLNKSTSVDGKLVFIDSDQNEIKATDIQDEISIEGGMPDVSVYVELWKKKTGVGLELNYIGTPEEGYTVTEISSTPQSLTIAGSEEALKEISKANDIIKIPAEMIDVSGASSDLVIEVPLEGILPEDTRLSSSMNDVISVHVSIMPVGSKKVQFDVDKLSVEHMKPGLALSYDKQTLNFKVKSVNGDPDSLDVDKIKATIDLQEYDVGDYSVPVKVELPEGFELVEDVNLSIHIKKR